MKTRFRTQTLGLAMYLWAERIRWPVPAAIRQLAGAVLSRGLLQTDFPVLDHWSKPISATDEIDRPAFASALGSALPVATPSAQSSAKASSPRLRCAVVVGVPGIGGLDKIAIQLALYLPAHDIETVFVVPDEGSEPSQASGEAGDKAYQEIRLEPRNFATWLRAYRPDVISLHGTTDWVVDSAAELGIPVVETLHGAHSFFDSRGWTAERLRSRKVASFVAVSELVRRQYLRANPQYSARRIITVPNGIDVCSVTTPDRSAARARLGLREQFLFVSLARYSLQKNTFGLVQAFDELARLCPDVHLLIAGPAQDINYCRQVLRLRDNLQHADRIHLRGNCDETATLLSAADGFVLNSFFEGWALASMEALASGLPIVTSEVGGAREQIGEDGTRGIVVANPLGDPEIMDWQAMSRARFSPQGNRKELVAAMADIVARREYWAMMRDDLRKESLVRFSIDRCVCEHAQALANAAGARISSTSSEGVRLA